MAITKTHSIKTTLNLAIEYICNPEKTDGKVLVSSFGCSPETADIEFGWTRERAPSQRGNVLARHLIQSFEPGETTPEIAHEIGKRFADEVLQGKYEYVLSTHIDKGHVHNHIIFNAVSFTDLKKYHSNKRSYREIRQISDKLCEEYGLSVLAPTGGRGKSYAEHTAARMGKSWKAKLRTTIDLNISLAKDFEDFLLRMEQNGYQVKRQNKNVSFCAVGRERYMRSKTLGEDYTTDAIIDRIAGKPHSVDPAEMKIYRLADLSEIQIATTGAKLNNLKQSAKTLNFLTAHGIDTYKELERAAEKAHEEFESVSSAVKETEQQINTAALLLKHIQTYTKLKAVYASYQKSGKSGDFREAHRAEIVLFETAFKELKAAGFPKAQELKTTYKELTAKKTLLYAEYQKKRAAASELDTVRTNIDSLLNIARKPPTRDISKERG